MTSRQTCGVIALCCIGVGVSLVPLMAQATGTGTPRFDSVKIAASKTAAAGTIRLAPGGSIVISGQTVRSLIRRAYDLQPAQVTGGPEWLDTDRFDIEGTVTAQSKTAPSMSTTMSRVQTLLADRFKLRVHRETRELPVFALIVKDKAKAGDQFKKHTGLCDPQNKPVPNSPTQSANCGTITRMTPAGGEMLGVGSTLAELALHLSDGSGHLVVDKTGMAGYYDFQMTFSRDQPGGAAGPSLLAGLQDTLGLTLDPQRAPVEVLVIDGAERPTLD